MSCFRSVMILLFAVLRNSAGQRGQRGQRPTSSPSSLPIPRWSDGDGVSGFAFTASPETFVVPKGVVQIKVTACGAQGQGQGGFGGFISAILPVKERETLNVCVGGTPYNGGGTKGGGGTDIRTASPGQDCSSGISSRLIVAGGGGEGYSFRCRGRGSGGGLIGGSGDSQTEGGSQTSGGNICRSGLPGSLWKGGDSESGSRSGGGGGGYYGGCGGSSCGAGGSSYATPTAQILENIQGDLRCNGMGWLTISAVWDSSPGEHEALCEFKRNFLSLTPAAPARPIGTDDGVAASASRRRLSPPSPIAGILSTWDCTVYNDGSMSNVCVWEGVTCKKVNGVGRVSEISFNYISNTASSISVGVPDVAPLAKLTHLSKLEMYGDFSFVGAAPESFCSLKSSLDLSFGTSPQVSCVPGCLRQNTKFLANTAKPYYCNAPTTGPTFSPTTAQQLGQISPLCELYRGVPTAAQRALLSNWCSAGSDPCRTAKPWLGVTCTNGLVTSVSLPNLGLGGPFPNSLGSISTLTAVDLQGNSFSGSLGNNFCAIPTRLSLNVVSNPHLTCYSSCLRSVQQFVKDDKLRPCGVNVLQTNTGVSYIIPIDLLTILEKAAILTAFYARILDSDVSTQRSGGSVLSLPTDYTVLDSSLIQLGSALGPDPNAREILISSFIPFSWDEMNSFIAAITSQRLNCASVCAAPRAKPMDIQHAVACGCMRRTATLVASAEVVILGSGLDVASCAPKSTCAEEVQEMLFDAINALVVKETLKACNGLCQALSQIAKGGSASSNSMRRLGSVSASKDAARRERQQNWQQDQLNKNTKNKSVKKKRAQRRRLQASQPQSDGASLSFSLQLNTNLMAVASGGTVSTVAQVSSLVQAVVSGLKDQVRLSATKLMTVGYLNMKLQHVKASSSFVTALSKGTAQASGLTNVDLKSIIVEMVVPSGGFAPPPVAALPTQKPTPLSGARPVIAKPSLVRTTPLPVKTRPTKTPTKKPTKRPTPEPTESEYTDDEPPTSYTDDAQAA